MQRIPKFPPLPRIDLDDSEDAQPTAVAPWRTAAALAEIYESEPTSSERQSGIRALLESTLARADLDVDSQRTLEMVRPTRPPPLPTTYSYVGPCADDIEIEFEELTSDREDERLDALVAVYEQRPTERPPPPPLPVPVAQRRVVEKKKTAVAHERLVERLRRLASIDIRIRLLALVAWTLLSALVTALLVR